MVEEVDKQEIWNIVLSELELLLSKANFKTWFQNTYISQLQDNGETVIVGVPNNFSKNWLEKKYHRFILEALQGATDNKVKKVIYKVEAAILAKEPGPETIYIDKLVPEKVPESNGHGLNVRYTFKNFIVGKGSELAYAACQAVIKQLGKKYNPLFIYGGVGLGKTHLLQAIGHAILEKNPKIKVLCTNAERFTNEFIWAIGNGTINKFKEIYRGVDVLLVDDIQFMAGKERTQEEFFHTFNSLHQDGQQIVLTSDRTPKDIPALEDRLISRLEWGLIADIAPPDLETRLAILKAKCQERKCNLNEEILQYLATHIQRNVRELEGALNKLIAYYEFHRTELDLSVVKNVLASLDTRRKKGLIQVKELIETVANFYGIHVSEMAGISRKRELVVPRQVAMYLMREEIGASFPLIGKELGNRDHTTAMHAYEKIKEGIQQNSRTKQEIDLIKQRLYN
ncbi:chromosomal replication initiator protein DnaA [Patescibacteria group bacterium]|nr:chromosomal replication initiator protein DnaA [Patescibacteria group bacterium]